MASKTTAQKAASGGGQFTPENPGQFAPESGGHLRPERGGQYERIFQLLSGGTLLLGIVLGFLFAIPRTLQGNHSADNGDTPDNEIKYRVNTNLEQISDWLTKIIVGVGLTQLYKISGYLKDISEALKPALGNHYNSGLFGILVIIFFIFFGFLTGYLVTRIYIGRIFKIADESVLEKEIENLKKQSTNDALALELVTQQLDFNQNSNAPEIQNLKTAIKSASPSARYTIFVQAHNFRKKYWRVNKDLMERTIPIFTSLIESENEIPNHQYYAQLGYALKDKSVPDFQAAFNYLRKAIDIRGNYKNHGWTLYEFNLAVCRIMLDADFIQGKKSDPDSKQNIENDLLAIKSEIGDREFKVLVESTEKVGEWIKLNEPSFV